MATDQNSAKLAQGGETALRRYDPRTAISFVYKSTSEETRRAYKKAIEDFFQFVGGKHPANVALHDVLRWRDDLSRAGKRPATVSFKLSVIRSFFEYLKAVGVLSFNPASSRLVASPEVPTEPSGRALTAMEVRHLLSGPDKGTPEGARDYALMLVMLRLSMRVAEVCSLRVSSVKWSHGRWTLRCKIKRGREEVWPLPKDVKQALDQCLKLDARRRTTLNSDTDAFLFQPLTNYRTLVFDKALSTRMVQKIVAKWGEFTGIGDVSPHDLRRTAITRALEMGQTYRQVQMMSKHKDPKTIMRYDHGRENLDQNAVNFLQYDEDSGN